MSTEQLITPAISLGQLLVVDDDAGLAKVLCTQLRGHGYTVRCALSGAEGLAALREQDTEVLLCDLMMPGMDGLALLKAALQNDPHLTAVVMTGQGTIESAVEAMKQGACDYVLKPFKMGELLAVLAKALELRRLRRENIDLRQTLGLYELTTTLRFTQDLNTILAKTAEVALQQTGVEEVSIMLPTPDGRELVVAVVRGEQRAHLLGNRISCNESVAGWVARHQEPLALEGPASVERFGTIRPRPGIGVSLLLPMLAGGKLAGILNLNDQIRRRAFSPGEVKGLQLLTSIAAEALEASQSHQQALQAEAQYRAIFDHAVVGIFQATPEGRYLKANLALAKMLGYDSPQELMAQVTDIGKQIYADPQRREELKHRLETEGRVQGFEVEAHRRDGSTLWVLISARVLGEGKDRYYEGMVEDITPRRQAEEAVRESAERYQRLAENAQDIIYRLRMYPNPAFEYINPVVAQILGYTPEEHYADPDLGQKIVHPDDQPLLLASMAQPGPVTEPLVLRWIHKDGRVVWTEQRNVLLRDQGGGLVAVEGIARDVTVAHREQERKLVMQRLRELVWAMQNPADLDQVMGAVEAGLRELGVPFRECSINRVEAESEHRVSFHHPSGLNVHQEKPQPFEASVNTVLQIWQTGQVAYRPDLENEDVYGEHEELLTWYRSPRRSVVDVPFSHGTLAINSDQPYAFTAEHIALVQDFAEILSGGFKRHEDLQRIKETEQQFFRSQKLEALGRLAGGVAHDFNNLITVIDGYSRMALKQLPAEESLLRSSVEEVQRAGERAEALVRQLLAFSRRQVVARQVLDLSQTVSGVEKMLRRLIGEDIDLVVRLGSGHGIVDADPGQLEQVLMNLVVNARDAMPEGGTLTIETAVCQMDEAIASNTGITAVGAYCRLSVRDTGVGMSPEVIKHIFEPFFTTKEEGHGTGLGLATVYGIIKDHQGGIQISSQQGKGTRVEIYLPCVESGAIAPSGTLRHAALPRGRETILLVEDEPSLRQVIGTLLVDLGYTVLEAERGDEALQTCRDSGQTIDLLFTDVVLPGFNGRVLAAQTMVLRPAIKVLFMSGYIEGSGHPLDEGAHFLPKPFTPEKLAHAVRSALDDAPPA